MTGTILKRHCAVYTRKSSEEGLEQAFNWLDARREACEAYIPSQKAEGWVLVRDRYDDGGVSGGTLDRPALQRLLADIEAGLVDVIVVYKIDRLSRSPSSSARSPPRGSETRLRLAGQGHRMGGWAPLGDDVKNRRLVVNRTEAATVPTPESITLHVPLRLQQRGGRKRVVTPDGRPITQQPQIDNALVKALADSHSWQRMPESGE